MSKRARKSVDNIFRYICSSTLEVYQTENENFQILNERISIRRNFGEFFKMVYNSVVGGDLTQDVPLHKLNDEQFSVIRDKITELVKEVSVYGFSAFIKNKKNCFCLYNISGMDNNERRLQIKFYSKFVYIIKEIYVYIYGSSTKEIDMKCERMQNIFELLAEEIDGFEEYNGCVQLLSCQKREDRLNKLKKQFAELEEKGIKIRETKTISSLYSELHSLLCEILSYESLSKSERQMYTDKKDYYIRKKAGLVFQNMKKSR